MTTPLKAPWLVLPVPSHANGFIPRGMLAPRPAAPPELRARKAPKRCARRPAR